VLSPSATVQKVKRACNSNSDHMYIAMQLTMHEVNGISELKGKLEYRRGNN